MITLSAVAYSETAAAPPRPTARFLGADSGEIDFTRRMAVGRASSDIRIDGSLDDEAWTSAARGTFRSNRSLNEWRRIGWTIIPTPHLGGMGTIYTAWDQTHLYLAFRCEKQVAHRNEPPAPAATGRDDAAIFDDDAVRILLQPRAGGQVYQIVVNANGAIWDGTIASDGRVHSAWNGDGIRAAGSDAPGHYEVEVAIPFKAMGVETPSAGDTWNVNFCRTERPSNEKTSWSMTDAYADADTFGVIEFAEKPIHRTVEGRIVTRDRQEVLAGIFVQTAEGLFRTNKDGRFRFDIASTETPSIQAAAFEYRLYENRIEMRRDHEVLPNIRLSRRTDDHIRVNMVKLAEDIYKTDPGFEYAGIHRRYQACPKGVVFLDNGKILVTYTAFGTGERRGNLVVIDSSSDGGHTWENEAVVTDGWRTAWGNFFHDPEGRLWMFSNPPKRVHLCENPAQSPMQWENRGLLDKTLDPLFAEELPNVRHPYALGENSPITLSDGTYLYTLGRTESGTEWLDAYASTDQGKTWYRRGSAWTPPEYRGFGEPMVVERKDGSLWMLMRLLRGVLWIGESVSNDGGRTWTDVQTSHIKHTDTRFHIRRLQSGRLLLVKHSDEAVEDNPGPAGREDLTAYLSEDDGKTWPYKLLIQEGRCSYPEAAQDDDGRLYIAYDVGRHDTGAEVRMAIVSEDDILNGEIVADDSKLGILISRIGPSPESSSKFAFEWTEPASSIPLP